MQQQVDQVVRARLDQALNSVFGRDMQATERAAVAAGAGFYSEAGWAHADDECGPLESELEG